MENYQGMLVPESDKLIKNTVLAILNQTVIFTCVQ